MLTCMGAPETPVEPEPGPGPVLEFDRVSFSVPDGRELLHEVSVEAAPSAITVLAGPSGSGKTTLLRLGNRLELPSSGMVRFRGVDVSESDPRRLRRLVGMVFQHPVPFAGTVRSNLAVGAPDANDDVLASALHRVGLDGSMLDRVADDLSGGEAQRMCIARTLLTDPAVILMDEPTSSLDPDNRIGIEQLARDLAAEGLAVVWVSHDLSQVERIADSVMVLVGGRNATAEEADRYLHHGPSEEER